MNLLRSRAQRLFSACGVILFTVLFPLPARSAGAPEDEVVFELRYINGEEFPYYRISPTDGDVLDRGLRTRTITLTFRSNRGERVACYDEKGRVVSAEGPRVTCQHEDGRKWRCFELTLDTRKLPNGPNRLFFRLLESSADNGSPDAALAVKVVVIHVLNDRLEIERRTVDSVRLKLEAGVVDPRAIKNYRFALFAAGSRTPWLKIPAFDNPGAPPEHLATNLPIGGRSETGAEPVLLYPPPSPHGSVSLLGVAAPETLSSAWPEETPALRFELSWPLLIETASRWNSKRTYVVAAVYDGKWWHWTCVVELAFPAPGTGLGLERN